MAGRLRFEMWKHRPDVGGIKCAFTDGNGIRCEWWFGNPRNSIDHVSPDYIYERFSNAKTEKHSDFIKRRYKEEIVKYFDGTLPDSPEVVVGENKHFVINAPADILSRIKTNHELHWKLEQNHRKILDWMEQSGYSTLQINELQDLLDTDAGMKFFASFFEKNKPSK